MREALLRHKDEFVLVLTEKLLTYALGRGLEYDDAPALRGIMRNAAPQSPISRSSVRGIASRAAAVAGSDDDGAAQFAPQLAALGIDGPFLVLDRRPVGMAGHGSSF